MKERENGYYWVRLGDNWHIAKWEYSNGMFHWLYNGIYVKDEYFHEIDENKILKMS